MSIKISADVRTALRKILRGHPNVLDYVKSKSEVNNLTRENLVKLADDLEINFIYELYNNCDLEVETVMEFEKGIKNACYTEDYQAAFSGQVLTDLKLSAFGESQTLKLKCNYESTPEWQYACLDDKRLKYRGNSSSVGLEVEVLGELSYCPEEDTNIREPEWLTADKCEGIWDMLDGPIGEKIYDQIERTMMEEDKVNRHKMGFPPTNEY